MTKSVHPVAAGAELLFLLRAHRGQRGDAETEREGGHRERASMQNVCMMSLPRLS